MLERAAFVFLSYLMGSVPFAYIAGKALKGIDLRRYGSHTVSGSNVYRHVSRPAIVVVGVLDAGKAAFPTWLAIHLGLGTPTAVAAGLAAVIGHDWPIYIGFKGGRGLGASMGMLLVLFPWGTLWLLASLGLGQVLGNGPLAALLGLLTLPLLAFIAGQGSPVMGACLAIPAIAVIKRLEANREPVPPGTRLSEVLLNRLLLDRDIRDREAWINRVPEE